MKTSTNSQSGVWDGNTLDDDKTFYKLSSKMFVLEVSTAKSSKTSNWYNKSFILNIIESWMMFKMKLVNRHVNAIHIMGHEIKRKLDTNTSLFRHDMLMTSWAIRNYFCTWTIEIQVLYWVFTVIWNIKKIRSMTSKVFL